MPPYAHKRQRTAVRVGCLLLPLHEFWIKFSFQGRLGIPLLDGHSASLLGFVAWVFRSLVVNNFPKQSQG